MITSYHITCSFLVFCTVCKIASTNQNTSCVMPETPVNGKVSIDRKGPTTSAVYSCDAGYILTGNKSRICGSNGEWEGSAPICSLDTEEENSLSDVIKAIIGVSVGGVGLGAVTLICKRKRIWECLQNPTCHCTYCPCNNQCPGCCGCCGKVTFGGGEKIKIRDQSSQKSPPPPSVDRQVSCIPLAPLDKESKVRQTV